LFEIVAFKTLDISQGSVATHFRCGGPWIFSDSIITNFLLILVPTPITTCSRIELIDQKSASRRTVKLVCVTKFTHSRVYTRVPIYRFTLQLLTCNLSSKFHFTMFWCL